MGHFELRKEGGLKRNNITRELLHANDKVYTDVFDSPQQASEIIANKMITQINAFTKAHPGQLYKLGLTTGRTPVSLYQILSERYEAGEVSFKQVAVYSIDEYYPIDPDAAQSRNTRIHKEFLDKVDIEPANVHVLDGTVPEAEVAAYCARFDAEARELDLLVIGIGEQGQVGFNEISSTLQSRTRMVILPYKSRRRQARNFNGDLAVTPKTALTMGISTMLSAKKVYLMAWGEEKAEVVARIVEGPQDRNCPATFFQLHPNIHFFVDSQAGSLLAREVAPWKIGPCE
ncbi:MAG: 6-phosphogluconolactonase [Bacteroidales bacterium]|nr:6-phosphogluconolactonase [Bacteroidales bacterium]